MPSVVKGVSGGVGVSEGSESGPLGSALSIVDKKVRNLEKRKTRLDGYRADSERGKELNSDQVSAISKYDSVLSTLEFAHELSGQFKTLLQEEERAKKKSLKKEAAERVKADAGKIQQVLRVQSIIQRAEAFGDWASILPEASKAETHGGIKAFMELSLGENAPEHFLALIDGKTTKKIASLNYAELKEGFTALDNALDDAAAEASQLEKEEEQAREELQKQQQQQQIQEEQENEVKEDTEVAEEVQEVEEVTSQPSVSGEEEQQQHPTQHQSSSSPTMSDGVVLMENSAAPPSAPPPQEEFNFLQESTIDPINMDPAVVVVQTSPMAVFNGAPTPLYTMPPFHPPAYSNNNPPNNEEMANHQGIIINNNNNQQQHQQQQSHNNMNNIKNEKHMEKGQQHHPSQYHHNAHHHSNNSNNHHNNHHHHPPNNNHSNNQHHHSQQGTVQQQQQHHHQAHPTIEDWSEGSEAEPREHNRYRGRGGYRGNEYRSGRGSYRRNRPRGVNGHYRGGDKEFRGRGGRGGGSHRGSSEKTNGHRE